MTDSYLFSYRCLLFLPHAFLSSPFLFFSNSCLLAFPKHTGGQLEERLFSCHSSIFAPTDGIRIPPMTDTTPTFPPPHLFTFAPPASVFLSSYFLGLNAQSTSPAISHRTGKKEGSRDEGIRPTNEHLQPIRIREKGRRTVKNKT